MLLQGPEPLCEGSGGGGALRGCGGGGGETSHPVENHYSRIAVPVVTKKGESLRPGQLFLPVWYLVQCTAGAYR